jgi:hypothetical protein
MDDVKSVTKLAAALQKAQLEFEPIIRDAQNPAFKRNGKISTYATLKSVIDTVRETLEKHGLVVIQRNIFREGMFGVASKLVHLESGEEYTSEFLAPIDKQSAQGVASCLTYARRSEYMTLLGLTPEDDDDGNAVSGINQFTQPNPQNGQQSPKSAPGRPKGRPKQAVKPSPEAITAPPAAQNEVPVPESPKTEENAPEAPKQTDVTILPTKEELQGFYTRAKAVSTKLGEAGLTEPGPKLVKFITAVAGVPSMPAIDKTKFEAIISRLEETVKNHPTGLIQTIEERIKT